MKIILIFILFSLTSLPSPHPLHVSIMQMDHNEETNTLERTLKAFVDDFELGLKDYSNIKVFLNDNEGSDSIDIIMEKFVSQMTSYKINGKTNEIKWIGWELEKDEVFIYYEIALTKKVKSISVQNDLLMNEYLDQVNIVHLKYMGKNKSFLLEEKKSEKAFEFE